LATAASHRTKRKASGAGLRSAWTAYAACAWAFVFAVPSFYWAAGGTGGLQSTVSPELVRLAQDRVSWFITLLWITGAMKVFAGLVALDLVQRWGRLFPRWVLLILAWGAGMLLAWHGALFVGAGLLMLAGVLPAPSNPHSWRWFAGTRSCGDRGSFSGARCSRRRAGRTCAACQTSVPDGSSACSVF